MHEIKRKDLKIKDNLKEKYKKNEKDERNNGKERLILK
jgi:hypothetical protein